MLIFGYNMIVGYQLYVCMKYIGQDTKAAASTVSTMAVITMVVPLVVPLVSGPISDRIGKRKLPVFVSSTIIAIGIAVPWVLSPSSPCSSTRRSWASDTASTWWSIRR